MIFTGLKQKSNQLFLNRNGLKLLENLEVFESNKTDRVLVFLDDIEAEQTILKGLTSILNVSKEKIELVSFQKRNQKNSEEILVITAADFGWFGKIKSEKLKIILTNKYDLLINYCKVDNLYTNLLLLQSKTAFKVGFAHLDNRLYDLIIKCNSSDITLFNAELKKYLEILNKI